MRSWSIPVGRLFGIEIRIHLTFLFLLVFVWSTEAAAQDATRRPSRTGLVGIVFGSVVLHELGHALVARGSGIPAKGIILLPIGGITVLDEGHAVPDPLNAWKRDIRIAVAGPLVNLFIAGFRRSSCSPLSGLFADHEPLLHSGGLLRSFVWANLIWACLTCCPRIRWMVDAFCALFSRATAIWFGPRSAPSASATSSPSCSSWLESAHPR